jgi:5-methylcytosine-specific restriction enzyme A
LFAHPSTLLRPLTDEDRAKLADLTVIPRQTSNAWIAIEDEAALAASGEKVIPRRIWRDISRDLDTSAMEGLSEERRVMVRTRAAWNAYKFVLTRQKAGRLTCDDCNFDPVSRITGTDIKPRSLLDVHHREPLAEGVRYTSPTDSYFKLLCPTCHRLEHALMRLRGTQHLVGQ